MSFFLSSPPQPTYQRSYQLPHQQHPFLTPQTHRSSFFSEPTTRPYPQFQPKSPSPLRPSWNTGNVMRRQEHTSKAGFDQNLWQGEPVQQENSTGKGTSFTIQPDTTHNTNITEQITSTTTNPSIDTTFSVQPTTSQRNPFTYQAPAQNLQPTNLLSTRLRQNRSTRRTLFLDRLRTSRRDERDNHIIERFEKEEYWRERRRREERMAREAHTEIEWEDEDVEEVDEGEMTPIDEEEEVGELVEGWLGRDLEWGQQRLQQQVHIGGDGGPLDDSMDAQFDFEDSDVEEAFMQVLSQQEERQSQSQLQPRSESQSQSHQQQQVRIPSMEQDEGAASVQVGLNREQDGQGNQDTIAWQKDTEML